MSPLDQKFRFPGEGEQRLWCGCCLQATAVLRVDKRGRPFLWCPNCLSRTFCGSDRALTGVRYFSGERLAALLRAMQAALAPTTTAAESAGLPAALGKVGT